VSQALDIDAAILAGGLGTRIAAILGEVPKVMAPVAGRPFLAHLLEGLARQGVRRAVLCLGHRARAVLDWLPEAPLPVEAVVEPRPLGTAGALRLARPLLRSLPVLVMNGDSWTDARLAPFLAARRAAGADGSLLCVEVAEPGRYGRVECDARGRVVRFREKDAVAAGPGLVNAGCYLFGEPLLERLMRDDRPSLEDLLGRLPPGTLHAHVVAAPFIDIGTPDSLAEGDGFFGAARRRRAT